MQFYVLLSVLFLGANALTPEQFSSLMSKIQEVGRSCVEKENATPADMAELVAYKIPPSRHEGKCMLACFYEHYNIMKDGNMDKQAAIESFNQLKSMDEELHGKVMKIIDICDEKKQIVEDRCETASLMATCVVTEAKAMGITKEAFLTS